MMRSTDSTSLGFDHCDAIWIWVEFELVIELVLENEALPSKRLLISGMTVDLSSNSDEMVAITLFEIKVNNALADIEIFCQ